LTLEVSFKWKTFGKSTFPEARNITFLKRDPYDESILKEVPDLDTVLKVLSYEDLSNKFFEIDVETTEGQLKDVDEEPPVERRRKTATPEKEVEEETPRKSFRRTSAPEAPARRKPVEKEEEPEIERVPARRTRPGRAPEPEIEAAPVRSSRRERAVMEPDKNERCPYGHRFGIDSEKFDDCDTCEIWGECLDKKEGK